MVRCKMLKNAFMAGYGDVSVGTVIELSLEDVQAAVDAGRVEILKGEYFRLKTLSTLLMLAE